MFHYWDIGFVAVAEFVPFETFYTLYVTRELGILAFKENILFLSLLDDVGSSSS